MVYLIFTIFSAVFITFGLSSLIPFIKKKKCTEKADGVVVDREVRSDSDGGSCVIPVFQYNYEGSEYTVRSHISSSKLKEGDRVRIFVDPEDHEKFYCAETVTSITFMSILPIAIGVGMMLYFVIPCIFR